MTEEESSVAAGPARHVGDRAVQRGESHGRDAIGYRLQLDVRNVLDETDLLPVSATTKVEVVRFATVEPRVFVLTAAFEF